MKGHLVEIRSKVTNRTVATVVVSSDPEGWKKMFDADAELVDMYASTQASAIEFDPAPSDVISSLRSLRHRRRQCA